MIITVTVSGDFGMPYTKSIWEGYKLELIPDFGEDENGEKAEAFLKKNKFRKIEPLDIKCGGNL